MDEESNELQDSQTPEETITPDDGGEVSEVQPQSDAEPVDLEQLKATNAKLYARLKKTEAENKQLKAKVPTEPSKQINPSPSDDEWKQRIELKTDGYTSEEVDAIMQLGGVKAVNNPLVKEAIVSIRKKAKSEAATPTDTAKARVYQNYTQDQLAAMSTEDLEKILPRAD